MLARLVAVLIALLAVAPPVAAQTVVIELSHRGEVSRPPAGAAGENIEPVITTHFAREVVQEWAEDAKEVAPLSTDRDQAAEIRLLKARLRQLEEKVAIEERARKKGIKCHIHFGARRHHKRTWWRLSCH